MLRPPPLHAGILLQPVAWPRLLRVVSLRLYTTDLPCLLPPVLRPFYCALLDLGSSRAVAAILPSGPRRETPRWFGRRLSNDSRRTPRRPGGDSGGDSGRTWQCGYLAACLAEWTDGVRELDPDGPDTQIHSDVAFDGTQFWFTWNRPNDAANFDVFASAVACDGSGVVSPFMVSESEQNEVDPVLAVGGEQVMFAWTGSSASGVDIRYRGYLRDGTPVTGATVFAASRNGAPVTGNAMLPDLAAGADGFVLAGSWGHSEAPASGVCHRPCARWNPR